MRRRRPHKRKSALAISILALALATALGTPPFEWAGAEVIDRDTSPVQFYVYFTENELLEPPFVRGSRIMARVNIAGVDSVVAVAPDLFPVSMLSPITTPGREEYDLAGPYAVGVEEYKHDYVDSCQQAPPPGGASPSDPLFLTLVQTDPYIDAIIRADIADSLALLTSPLRWSPPEADTELYGGFCTEWSLHTSDWDDDICDSLAGIGMLPAGDIDVPEAWAITRGNLDVVVAVVDFMGVNWLHPDLADSILGPSPDLMDVMLSDAAPRIARPNNEVEGDANHDDASGRLGVNEDQDDWTDEDPTGLVHGNTVEADVIRGTWAFVGVDSLVAAGNPEWTPGSLVGQYVAPAAGAIARSAVAEKISWNSSNAIKTSTVYFQAIEDLKTEAGLYCADSTAVRPTEVGWQGFAWVSVGTTFMISDRRDTDGDEVVDDWWPYDPRDDDENGLIDDIRGFAIHSLLGRLPWSSGSDPDATGRADTYTSSHDHGTANAGIVAAGSDEAGIGLIGIAPNVRILPVDLEGLQGSDAYALWRLLQYKDENGDRLVDVVVFAHAPIRGVSESYYASVFAATNSNGDYVHPIAAATAAAIEAGIVVVNASGNSNVYLSEGYFMGAIPGVISAGGIQKDGEPWYDLNGGGMIAGPWVDILAPVQQVTRLCTGTGCNPKYGLPSPYGVVHYAPPPGTSRAAPHVGGVAALVKSAYDTCQRF